MTSRQHAPAPPSPSDGSPHSADSPLAAIRHRMTVALEALESVSLPTGATPSPAGVQPLPDRADIDAAIDVVDAAIAMLERGAGASRSTANG